MVPGAFVFWFDGRWIDEENEAIDPHPSHWMPLPEPPK